MNLSAHLTVPPDTPLLSTILHRSVTHFVWTTVLTGAVLSKTALRPTNMFLTAENPKPWQEYFLD